MQIYLYHVPKYMKRQPTIAKISKLIRIFRDRVNTIRAITSHTVFSTLLYIRYILSMCDFSNISGLFIYVSTSLKAKLTFRQQFKLIVSLISHQQALSLKN